MSEEHKQTEAEGPGFLRERPAAAACQHLVTLAKRKGRRVPGSAACAVRSCRTSPQRTARGLQPLSPHTTGRALSTKPSEETEST